MRRRNIEKISTLAFRRVQALRNLVLSGSGTTNGGSRLIIIPVFATQRSLPYRRGIFRSVENVLKAEQPLPSLKSSMISTRGALTSRKRVLPTEKTGTPFSASYKRGIRPPIHVLRTRVRRSHRPFESGQNSHHLYEIIDRR